MIQNIDLPGGSDSKVSVYDAGDPGLIPGLGRSPGEGNAIHSRTIAWKIPWTEEPGRLQPMRSQSWTRLSDFTFTFFFQNIEAVKFFLKDRLAA